MIPEVLLQIIIITRIPQTIIKRFWHANKEHIYHLYCVRTHLFLRFFKHQKATTSDASMLSQNIHYFLRPSEIFNAKKLYPKTFKNYNFDKSLQYLQLSMIRYRSGMMSYFQVN